MGRLVSPGTVFRRPHCNGPPLMLRFVGFARRGLPAGMVLVDTSSSRFPGIFVYLPYILSFSIGAKAFAGTGRCGFLAFVETAVISDCLCINSTSSAILFLSLESHKD